MLNPGNEKEDKEDELYLLFNVSGPQFFCKIIIIIKKELKFAQ